jgi:hypothetical protein
MASLLERLERDWKSLARDREVAARLPEVMGAAGGVRTLGEVQRFTESSPPAGADLVLVALVRRAVEGDQLAARALLQLLLPGVRRLAQTWWSLGDREEREAAAVAAVWDRIVSYPLARRPGKVAANILLDAAGMLRGQVRDTRMVVSLDEAGESTTEEPVHPAEDLLEVLTDAVENGLITREDAHLVALTRIGGFAVTEIARARGVPPRTLQTHRHAAEAALIELGVAA